MNFSKTNFAKEHSQEYTQEELQEFKEAHILIAKACQSYLDTFADCFNSMDDKYLKPEEITNISSEISAIIDTFKYLSSICASQEHPDYKYITPEIKQSFSDLKNCMDDYIGAYTYYKPIFGF